MEKTGLGVLRELKDEVELMPGKAELHKHSASYENGYMRACFDMQEVLKQKTFKIMKEIESEVKEKQKAEAQNIAEHIKGAGVIHFSCTPPVFDKVKELLGDSISGYDIDVKNLKVCPDKLDVLIIKEGM
jgi:hypothetical protein